MNLSILEICMINIEAGTRIYCNNKEEAIECLDILEELGILFLRNVKIRHNRDIYEKVEEGQILRVICINNTGEFELESDVDKYLTWDSNYNDPFTKFTHTSDKFIQTKKIWDIIYED